MAGCQITSISDLTIPTATDTCDVTILGALSAGFVFPYSFSGTQTIDWYFTDSYGNVTIQEQDITLTPLPVTGGTLTGTYNNEFFSSQVDVSSCGTNISIALNLSGESGTIVRWEKFAVNHGVWEVITNMNDNYTASFLSGTLESTYYRVLVKNGTCTEYSNQFYVRALPAGAAPTVTNLDAGAPDYCLGDVVNLLATSNYSATQPGIPNDSPGDFNEGQLNTNDPDGWLVDGNTGGFTAGGNATNPRNWSATNDHPFGGITYDSTEGKFAIAYGNYYELKSNGKPNYDGNIPTTLESPIMDLSNAESASLDFDQAFYFVNNDYAIIEISIDGGVTYTTLRMIHAEGSGTLAWFTAGTAESVVGSDATHYNFNTDNTSISLAAYLGESNVRIRWSFTGRSNQSVWAMDNIFVNKEVLVETEVEWTDGIGDPNVPPIAGGQTNVQFTFKPDAPGHHQYGGTALINGCRTYSAEGTELIDIYVSYAYAGENVTYTSQDCGQNTIQLNAYDNTKSAIDNAAKGAFTIPSAPPGCINCDDPGTGEVGTWTVTPDATNSCGTGIFSTNNPTKYPNPKNDPDAMFTAEAGIYTLTWTVNGCGNSITVETTNCKEIDFDGNKDYVDFEDNFDLENKSAFSIEVWVKPQLITGSHSIFSKRDANYSGNQFGYDLSIDNSGKVSFNWNQNGKIDSDIYKIGTDRWYHIAITRSTLGEYKLYIDGILIKLEGGGTPRSNNNKAILGAMDADGSNVPLKYFNGWMDEFRIWDVALSSDQIHQMMNQKIISSPTILGNVQGETIPIDINGLVWANLLGYYQMESVSCGFLNPTAGSVPGKLRNIDSSQDDSAPIPYTSKVDGQAWGTDNTWTHFDVWDVPNSTGVNGAPIDWNIVKTSHDITSGARNITLLGLLSEAGKLTIDGSTNMSTGTGTGQSLWITNYLKLNGIIDLEGESQLVQKRYGTYNASYNFSTTQFSESVFDEASSGYIERDQQGQKNSFNYNYWSSPVTRQGAANNAPYKLSDVLWDGTYSANLRNIDFVDGAYSADTPNGTNPIKITSRWIWTYRATIGADLWANYYQWVNVGYWGSIKVGDGYSMKGTGGAAPINATQNYVFVGKPNSGDITTTQLNPNQTYLIGNPYPSALDANEFIRNNGKDCVGCTGSANVFDGTLRFWDHFGLSNNHLLAQYEGGYATYSLGGGVRGASNVPLTANTGTVNYSKIPGRYIPVGQGFFVVANNTTTPGNLNFKNGQRVFQRESSGSSVFMKTATSKKSNTQEMQETTADNRPKIRLTFISSLGYHRPLLVTMDENTSNQFDFGYDAPLNEDNKEDMFWQLGQRKLVIQGVNNFDENQELPLGLKISEAGLAIIKIEALENMDENITVHIRDKFTGKTHNITHQPFEIELESGEYLDRFDLVFKMIKLVANDVTSGVLEVAPVIEDHNYHVFMNNTIAELQIKNNGADEIRSISLYNNLGQTIITWNKDLNRRIISLPVKLATGVYMVQINTINGSINKRIIIE